MELARRGGAAGTVTEDVAPLFLARYSVVTPEGVARTRAMHSMWSCSVRDSETQLCIACADSGSRRLTFTSCH